MVDSLLCWSMFQKQSQAFIQSCNCVIFENKLFSINYGYISKEYSFQCWLQLFNFVNKSLYVHFLHCWNVFRKFSQTLLPSSNLVIFSKRNFEYKFSYTWSMFPKSCCICSFGSSLLSFENKSFKINSVLCWSLFLRQS